MPTFKNRKPGYRGLRKTENRAALLGAGEELFGTHGLSGVSIDDIVHLAGVAKGTFYNHFKDKHDIAHHVALEIRYETRDQIGRFKHLSADPAFHLSVALQHFLRLAIDAPHKANILITMLTEVSDVGAPMNERVRMVLQLGKAAGRFSFPSLDAALALVLGVVSGGVRAILERDDPAAQQALINDLVVHALRGLGLSPNNAEDTVLAVADANQLLQT